eukprot:gene11610-4852_t
MKIVLFLLVFLAVVYAQLDPWGYDYFKAAVAKHKKNVNLAGFEKEPKVPSDYSGYSGYEKTIKAYGQAPSTGYDQKQFDQYQKQPEIPNFQGYSNQKFEGYSSEQQNYGRYQDYNPVDDLQQYGDFSSNVIPSSVSSQQYGAKDVDFSSLPDFSGSDSEVRKRLGIPSDAEMEEMKRQEEEKKKKEEAEKKKKSADAKKPSEGKK